MRSSACRNSKLRCCSCFLPCSFLTIPVFFAFDALTVVPSVLQMRSSINQRTMYGVGGGGVIVVAKIGDSGVVQLLIYKLRRRSKQSELFEVTRNKLGTAHRSCHDSFLNLRNFPSFCSFSSFPRCCLKVKARSCWDLYIKTSTVDCFTVGVAFLIVPGLFVRKTDDQKNNGTEPSAL